MTTMNTKHYILLLATALLAGCAFDDPQDKDWSKPLFHSDSELVPVTFSMSSQHNIDLTRAETSIITFDQGEKVKVLAMPYGETSYTGYDYTTDAAAQSVGLVPVSSQPYFPAGDNTTIEAYAYYPATASIGSETVFSVADNQSSDAAYKASDLMFASNRTITKDLDDGKNHLKMNHQMAQLRISANPATETATTINITEIQVVAKKSLIFTPEGTTVSTTTGDPGTIIARYGAGEAYVLIPPQVISDVQIKVITGGGSDSEIATYGFTAEGSFQAGNSYGVDITLTADQLGMTTAISNWNGMGSVVIAPSGDLVITPIAAQRYNGGTAIEPELEVKKNGVPLVKDEDYEVLYLNNKNAGTAYVVVTGKAGTNFEGCVGVAPFTITEAEASILYDGHATSTEMRIYGAEPFTKHLTNQGLSGAGDGMVTYASSNEAVATVDPATGEVTIVKPGTTTITATVTDGANFTYPVKTASYVLTVSKDIADLSFATTNPPVTWSETASENNYSQTAIHTAANYAIIPASAAQVVYSIIGNTNTCGATIDGSTVTFTKAGSVTILATVEDNDYYTYGTKTASYVLTVNPHAGKLTLSANSGTVNFGSTGTFTVNDNHGGTITVASGNEDVATVAYNADNKTVTITTVGAGSTKVTVACAATDCYAEAKAEYDLVVGVVTASVTPPSPNSLTYNGDPRPLLTAGSVTGGTMYYRAKPSGGGWIGGGDGWSTSVPQATDAGTYILEYKVVGDANHTGLDATSLNNAVIAKATPTGVWSNTTATIGCGASFTRTLTITGVKGESFTTSYQSDNVNVATVNASGVVTGEAVGSAKITASSAATDNYNALSASYDLTVTIGTPNVTAPTARNRTYDGTAQALLNAGSTSGGTLEYSTNNSTWSTTIPTATNAGDYTVYYRVVGNANYGTVPSTPVPVTISPKAVTAPIIVLATTSYTYDGSAKQPAVSAVKDGSTTIPASEYTVSWSNNTNASNAALVTITDEAGGNYTVNGNQTFTINRAAGYVTLSTTSGEFIPSGTSKSFTISSTHGGDLSVTTSTSYASASRSGNTVTVTPGSTAGQSATITVTSAATTNYNAASATYIATVAPTLSAATSSHVGWVISTSGYIFSTNAKCTNAGQAAVAMVAYVGSAGSVDASFSAKKGLAIALSDAATKINFCKQSNSTYTHCGCYGTSGWTNGYSDKHGYSNTSSYIYNHGRNGHSHPIVSYLNSWNNSVTRPSGASTWFLPSMGQALLMANRGINSLMGSSNVGGTSFSGKYYWVSNEYQSGNAPGWDAAYHCSQFTGTSGTSKNYYDYSGATAKSAIRFVFAF